MTGVPTVGCCLPLELFGDFGTREADRTGVLPMAEIRWRFQLASRGRARIPGLDTRLPLLADGPEGASKRGVLTESADFGDPNS